MRATVAALMSTLLLACSSPGSPEVVSGWVAEAPPTATVMAGYLQLENGDSQSWTLQSLSSPQFARIEMHDMSMQNGRMQMRQMPSLTLAGGETATFEPGGKHLMLHDPQQAMREGSEVELQLRWENNGGDEKIINTRLPVKSRMSGGDHSGH